MMIEKLEPQSFDERIQELEQQKVDREAQAREIIITRNKAEEEASLLLIPQPLAEITPPVKASYAELLRRAMKNLKRFDSTVIWSLLHKDIHQALISILDCKDLGAVSEACYLIHDKLPRVDLSAMAESNSRESEYFYEIPHGELLGADSWAKLVQSQILYNTDPAYVGIPVVQSNRYKIIKPYHVHIRVTFYVLHCTEFNPPNIPITTPIA